MLTKSIYPTVVKLSHIQHFCCNWSKLAFHTSSRIWLVGHDSLNEQIYWHSHRYVHQDLSCRPFNSHLYVHQWGSCIPGTRLYWCREPSSQVSSRGEHKTDYQKSYFLTLPNSDLGSFPNFLWDKIWKNFLSVMFVFFHVERMLIIIYYVFVFLS